jgi:hypothetical protein
MTTINTTITATIAEIETTISTGGLSLITDTTETTLDGFLLGDGDNVYSADSKESRLLLDLPLESLSQPVLAQTSANSGGQWGPRDGAVLRFIGNDAYLIGGWAGGLYDSDWDDNPSSTTNQVYKTSNKGQTWTRIRNHAPSPDATHFTVGHWFNVLEAEDALWILNGDTGLPNNGPRNSDVRRSTDGITWTKQNSGNAPYHNYFFTIPGYLDGTFYIFGGHTDGNASSATNAGWKSLDGGVNWTATSAAPWTARGNVERLVNHQGKLWLIGGARHDNVDGNRVYYNDVWSFDGTTWTQVLANGHSQWEGRLWANVFELDGWMYISRGYNASNKSTTFRSRDGIEWESVDWTLTASHADSLGVHSTGVLIAAGNWTLSGTPVNTTSPSYFATSYTDPIISLIDYVAANGGGGGGGTDYVFNPSGTVLDLRVGGEAGTLATTVNFGNYLIASNGQCVAGRDGSAYYLASGFITDTQPIFLGSGENQVRLRSLVHFRATSADAFVISTNLTDRLTINSSGQFFHTAGTGFIGSHAASASVVYTKVANTDTSGLLLWSLAENATDGSTPFWIGRYGSTHATKPNQIEFWNYNNGAISVGVNNQEIVLMESTQLTLRKDLVFVPYSSKTLSVNGQMAIEATGNETGNIVFRGSDGTTRRAPFRMDTSGATVSAAGQSLLVAANAAAQLSLIGAAAASHSHAGSDITSGTVDPARLGSGTSITTKFLRGDSTWQSIAGGGDALVANPLSQFAATTSSQLAGVISDETGSGALVFATSPTLVTPVLGVATATSINNVTITDPGGSSPTLRLAAGSTLRTLGDGFSIIFTATATSSLTLPTSGTLATVSGALGTPTSGTLTNCTGYTFANIASKPTTLSGYGITDAQGIDATLTAFAGLTIAANSLTIGTGADAFSQTTFAANTFPARASTGSLVAKSITDFGLSLIDDADNTAARTTLGLGTLATQSGTFSGTSSGTNTGDQTSIVGISGTKAQFDTACSDGNFVYASDALGTPSSGTLTNCSGLPLSGVVDSTSEALGVGTLELGHATDTTISRTGAGDIAIEGNAVYRAGGTDVPLTDGGTGASTAAAARTNLQVASRIRTITFIVDGGGSVITTGTKGYLPKIPFAGTIVSWRMIAKESGSAVVDVWKAASAVPTNGNTITASAKPTLTAQQLADSSTLTGWTTSIAVGDVFGWEVESATTVTQLTLVLEIQETH